jgi:apolipoprotein N-acyltransferase
MQMRFLSALERCAGKRRLLLVALFGAAAAASLPPYHFLAAGALGFSGFFWTAFSGELSPKRAFKDGLAFGFGYFLAGLYWIPVALTVDAERYFWLMPVAAIGIPLVLSFYIGGACALAAKLSLLAKGGFFLRTLFFIAAWIGFEGLRGLPPASFPWNLVGYSLVSVPSLLQAASLGGIWLLGALALALFLLPAAALAVIFSRVPLLSGLALTALLAFPLFAASRYGGERLEANGTAFHEGVKARIVQPNIPQTLKWEPEKRYEHLQLLAGLSKTDDPELKYVVWPESAVPYMVALRTGVASAMAEAAPKGGGVIAGAVRGETNRNGEVTQVWNSLVVVNGKGEIARHYDKSRLVPFGEYVPLKRLFPFVAKITDGLVDFSRGGGPVAMELPGFPSFSPLVCYEVIFPGSVLPKDGKRPELILNVTNDAWYGDTSGPYQHFAMAVVRAVEEGVPVVRAANNGISGVVDPLGRVLDKTDLGTRGILDVYLPKPLQEPPFFATLGR